MENHLYITPRGELLYALADHFKVTVTYFPNHIATQYAGFHQVDLAQGGPTFTNQSNYLDYNYGIGKKEGISSGIIRYEPLEATPEKIARNRQHVCEVAGECLWRQAQKDYLAKQEAVQNGCTDETVCLLSKLKPEHHIEVDLNLDEMDLTSAELKATYDEIKGYVLKSSGLKVSSLYIAQVKEKMGIKEREDYNNSKKEDAKVPQCPADKETAIIDAFKHFNMVD